MTSVLFVEEALFDTGHTRIVLDTMRELSAQGWDPRLFSVRSAIPSGTLDLSGIDLAHGLRRPHSLGIAGPAVLARLVGRARRADIVISGGEVGIGVVFAALAAAIAGKPFVIWAQADVRRSAQQWMPRRTRPLLWRAYRSAAGIAALSPGMVPDLRGLAPQARIEVVGPPFDAPSIRRRAAEPDQPGTFPHPELPTAVAIGRLTPQKGFDLLLHAVAGLGSTPTLNLLIVGDGESSAELEHLTDELGLRDRVRFAGHRANPYPPLARADLFVLSSRFEGFALVLLEALALGVPTIATRCPSGPEDVLADGAWGDLVPPGDVAALTAAIRAHLEHPERLRRLAAARQRHPFPTASESAAALARFLTDVATGRSPSPAPVG